MIGFTSSERPVGAKRDHSSAICLAGCSHPISSHATAMENTKKKYTRVTGRLFRTAVIRDISAIESSSVHFLHLSMANNRNASVAVILPNTPGWLVPVSESIMTRFQWHERWPQWNRSRTTWTVFSSCAIYRYAVGAGA
jgi:hypothetical protein